MRLPLLCAALLQFACVAHYRFPVEETKQLDGFDVHNEHVITTMVPVVSGGGSIPITTSMHAVQNLVSDKPYRLVHRSGYSLSFNSATPVAFLFQDGSGTEPLRWRTIQIEDGKWVAVPMDETKPKVEVPMAALKGCTVTVPSVGRSFALAGGITGGAGAILLIAGLLQPPKVDSLGFNTNLSVIVLDGIGGGLLLSGVLMVALSPAMGWNLDSD